MICLPCSFVPPIGFIIYMHLYTLAYMSMHESCLLVCRPCFNTMKLWTSDPNLHLSFADTALNCLLSCFVSLFARILVSMFAMSIMFICFMPLYCAFCIFSFHSLSAGFLSLPLHVRTWSEDAWTRAQSPEHKQKGRGCEHANMSQAAAVSRFRSLAFPLVMYSFKPFHSSSLSPLDGLY